MTLSEYTAKRGTIKCVAIDTGLTYDHIRHLARGEYRATIADAARIERVTGVPAETMIAPQDLEILAYLRGK